MDAVANHCRVGLDDRLLIRWPAPITDGERVVLRRGEIPGTRGEPVRGDSVAVPLDGLEPGAWDVRMEAGGIDRPLLTDDPGFSLDELRAYAGRRRDRAVRVVRSADGRVTVHVREVVPHAEVEAVHPRNGEIRVEGRLAYAGPRPGDEARLVAVARKSRVTLTRPAGLDGTDFHACLPVDAFAAEEPAIWDLRLDVGDVQARLATRLDDAPGKRGKLSYPRQVAVSGGGEMTVRPYYTVRDELAIGCHLAGGEGAR